MDLPEVADWFVAVDLGQGISRLREPNVHPLIQANVYLVRGERRDLVIDSGTGIVALRPFLPVMRAEPKPQHRRPGRSGKPGATAGCGHLQD